MPTPRGFVLYGREMERQRQRERERERDREREREGFLEFVSFQALLASRP